MIPPIRHARMLDAGVRAGAGSLVGPWSSWFAVFLGLVALASCSKSDSGGPAAQAPDTVVHRGVAAGSAGDSGTVLVTLITQEQAPSVGPTVLGLRAGLASRIDSATVEIVIGSTRSRYRGGFDASTGELVAISGAYATSGVLGSGRFHGTYTRLGHNGGLVTILPSTAGFRACCGGWSGSRASGLDHGTLGFVLDGALVVGVARNDDGTLDMAEGSVNLTSGEILFTFPSHTFVGMAQGNSFSGTYSSTLDGGRTGTWRAIPCSF